MSFVSGFHPVRETLLQRPKGVESVLLQRDRKDARMKELETLARQNGVPVRQVPKEELDRLGGKAHNGVVAKVATRELDSMEACLAGEPGTRIVVFLDEVTDPGNVGAIVRTAAALGASVVLTERHSAALGDTVAKAAAGALERVRIGRAGNAARFLEDAKKAGFWVFGAAMEGEPASSVDLSGDVVLCLGAEGEGLRRLTKETCDRLVSIPMVGGGGSLNVSVAAAILLWEVRRTRIGHENGLTAGRPR